MRLAKRSVGSVGKEEAPSKRKKGNRKRFCPSHSVSFLEPVGTRAFLLVQGTALDGELWCNKNQTNWLINIVRHRFRSMLIMGAAMFNGKLRVYLVPLAFRRVILTYSGISGDTEGQEASFFFPKRTLTGCVIFRRTENNSDSSFSRWICVVSDLKYLLASFLVQVQVQVVVHQSIENTPIQYMPHTGRELKCPLSSKKALSASTNACVYRGPS